MKKSVIYTLMFILIIVMSNTLSVSAQDISQARQDEILYNIKYRVRAIVSEYVFFSQMKEKEHILETIAQRNSEITFDPYTVYLRIEGKILHRIDNPELADSIQNEVRIILETNPENVIKTRKGPTGCAIGFVLVTYFAYQFVMVPLYEYVITYWYNHYTEQFEEIEELKQVGEEEVKQEVEISECVPEDSAERLILQQ